jgi:hypothetical protein
MTRKLLLFIVFFLIFLAISLVFLQDLIWEFIAVPLAYLIWIGKLFFKSLDQKALWISFLIISLITSVLSLNISSKRTLETIFVRGARVKGVLLWKERLEDTKRGEYLRWRLAQHLSTMVLEGVAYRHGLTFDQAKKKLRDGALEIPETIRTYLEASQKMPVITGRLKRLLTPTESPLDIDPEMIVEYLETDLEITARDLHVDELK